MEYIPISELQNIAPLGNKNVSLNQILSRNKYDFYLAGIAYRWYQLCFLCRLLNSPQQK